MKMIAGILKPTSGRVEFDGHDWSRNDLKEIGALISPGLIKNLKMNLLMFYGDYIHEKCFVQNMGGNDAWILKSCFMITVGMLSGL